MERGPIVHEYFRLRDHLNRANRTSNQKTEIKFEIDQTDLFEYRLYAVSSGQNEMHKIALAERGQNRIWERTGNTKFQIFEEFCAHFLNDLEIDHASLRRPRYLSNNILKILAEKFMKKIEMLLLNKNYEP